jgi:hypothetical protein
MEPLSGQTKYCNNGMCCFSTKQAVLRRNNKGWLARDQDDASEWALFNELATIEIQQQHSAGRHVAPLGHVNLIQVNQSFLLHFNDAHWFFFRNNKYKN